jgi:hypothetical protein
MNTINNETSATATAATLAATAADTAADTVSIPLPVTAAELARAEQTAFCEKWADVESTEAVDIVLAIAKLAGKLASKSVNKTWADRRKDIGKVYKGKAEGLKTAAMMDLDAGITEEKAYDAIALFGTIQQAVSAGLPKLEALLEHCLSLPDQTVKGGCQRKDILFAYTGIGEERRAVLSRFDNARVLNSANILAEREARAALANAEVTGKAIAEQRK